MIKSVHTRKANHKGLEISKTIIKRLGKLKDLKYQIPMDLKFQGP